MSKHEVLSSITHKELRIDTSSSVDLGDVIMSCITVPTEYRNIQNNYPILFQLDHDRDEFHSIALFGFEKGENLFIKDNAWEASYKPLAIEIVPFLIGMPKQDNVDAQIHIDINSPRVQSELGQRVFDDEGKATDYLEGVSKKLAKLHDGYKRNKAFIESLRQLELLEPFVLEIKLKDGSKNRLVGFHTINEQKLSELDGNALSELNKKGYLMPIYMAAASLSNFAVMVERKNALLVND